jgi:hypothetical protein
MTPLSWATIYTLGKHVMFAKSLGLYSRQTSFPFFIYPVSYIWYSSHVVHKHHMHFKYHHNHRRQFKYHNNHHMQFKYHHKHQWKSTNANEVQNRSSRTTSCPQPQVHANTEVSKCKENMQVQDSLLEGDLRRLWCWSPSAMLRPYSRLLSRPLTHPCISLSLTQRWPGLSCCIHGFCP